MGKRSILINALVVAIVVPVGAAQAEPRFQGYPAEATVSDLGQSVQSDGLGPYVGDGDIHVRLLDSSQPAPPDYFSFLADPSGSSRRVLHLSIPALAVDTDCASSRFFVFSKSNPNWFNTDTGTASKGSADLDCEGGRHKPAYEIIWSGCVDITSVAKEYEFNFKASSSCTATVRQSLGGPSISSYVSVPFDITARRKV